MLNHYSPFSCDSIKEELVVTPVEKGPSLEKESSCEISLKRRTDGKIHTTWQEYTVENVSQYLFLDKCSPMTTIKCPEFSSGAGIDHDKWHWCIKFNHSSYNTWVYVEGNCTKNNVGVRAIIAIYVIDNKGNEIFFGHRPDRYDGVCDYGIASFFNTKYNFDKNKFLPNDSLTLRLKLTILLDDKTPFPAYFPLKLEPSADLPSHFEELYRSRENTGDIVIEVEGKLFRMHKEVLKIRYPRLLNKFAIQVFQGKKNFQISGIDSNVFEKLLEFMYLDKVTGVDDCIVPLWKAAHKYKLTALKCLCEKIISEDFLSVENAEIVRNLTKKFGSGSLLNYIDTFLMANNITKFIFMEEDSTSILKTASTAVLKIV